MDAWPTISFWQDGKVDEVRKNRKTEKNGKVGKLGQTWENLHRLEYVCPRQSNCPNPRLDHHGLMDGRMHALMDR